jgi:predicted O-methyltransferase YrrM
MDDHTYIDLPAVLPAIEEETRRLNFKMGSEVRTGVLLQMLAASKPGGLLLELGTGTGLGTAWLLEGMDPGARLISADNDPACLEVAKRHLGKDERVEFREGDGSAVIDSLQGSQFDLLFADTWPGKFWDLEKAVHLVKEGGFYIIDDLLPQESWPEGHAEKVPPLLEQIRNHPDLVSCRISWSTGLVIATKRTPLGL